jgi:hypothetical protein
MESSQSLQITQIGLHSVKNLLGQEEQLTLFSEHKTKAFAGEYGITLERALTKYGVDLTDVQQRVMEGILHGFSRTKYEGNVAPEDKLHHGKEKYPPLGKLPPSYKYVQKLPRLRVSQAEILDWANINRKSAGSVKEAIDALKHLGTYQYCFYYTRLTFDENAQAVKDKQGEWIKEEVVGIDTLFTITEVRDEKTKVLKYYEIIPSSLFMDQRESYFMLIPYNWREEVRKIVGQKKASSYTFRFLLFLRYQFELKRRAKKEQKPYSIKWSPEEIGIAIKMPLSIYKKFRKRANQILEDVYLVAKQLGYLTNYERTGTLDILYLNEEKYYAPRNQESLVYTEDLTSPELMKAKELLDFFNKAKKTILPRYNPQAGGTIQKASLKYLSALLSTHPFEEIKQIIEWGIARPYWCNRIGTPSKLYKYYHEACAEMNASKSTQKTHSDNMQDNKSYASECAKKFQGSEAKIEVLNAYVEVGNGIHQPTCINYSEKEFRAQFEHALRKWNII